MRKHQPVDVRPAKNLIALRLSANFTLVHEAAHARPAERTQLEVRHGQVWNTAQLETEFTVIECMPPFVVVIRKSDKKRGSLYFQHSPRYYFAFEPEGN